MREPVREMHEADAGEQQDALASRFRVVWVEYGA